jgi:hypothetical protein
MGEPRVHLLVCKTSVQLWTRNASIIGKMGGIDANWRGSSDQGTAALEAVARGTERESLLVHVFGLVLRARRIV